MAVPWGHKYRSEAVADTRIFPRMRNYFFIQISNASHKYGSTDSLLRRKS